jgi:hypothetical protein
VNVTSSRALGTTYTNNTGRPIFVLVALNGNSGSTTDYSASTIVNGVGIMTSYSSGAYNNPHGGNAGMTISFIVPTNATYMIVTSQIWGVNGSIVTWFELS